MICATLWGLLLLTITGSDGGQDKVSNDKPKTPAEQFQELTKDYDVAKEKFGQMLDASKTPEERDKAWERDPSKTYAPRFLDLAKANPKDATALDALSWVLTQLDFGPVLNEALEILSKEYVEDSRMKRVLLHHYGQLGLSLEPGVQKFLHALISKSKDKDTQGLACYTLGQHLKLRAVWRKAWEEGDENMRTKIEKEYGMKFVETLRESNWGNLNAEMEQSFAMVAEKYADMKLKPTNDKTFANRANSELYEIRHLSIGKLAPEIEGEDVAGKKFKLSDYRGKIVVLTFWAEWCSSCRAMYPQERLLVKRLENKPFALIGINSDSDKERLKEHMEKEEISWRSWWDGGSRAGPIGTKWNVWAWPTIYVLDHKGVIRDKGVRGKTLDAAVDKLLKEIE